MLVTYWFIHQTNIYGGTDVCHCVRYGRYVFWSDNLIAIKFNGVFFVHSWTFCKKNVFDEQILHKNNLLSMYSLCILSFRLTWNF
jgi:hypothetical protein